MVNIMIDIETMSTASNATILTIGAIPFLSDGTIPVDPDMYFYERVQLESYDSFKNNEFDFDFSTLIWWLKQDSEPLKDAFLENPRFPIKVVMQDLANYLMIIKNLFKKDIVNVWSHGKDFDVVILQNAFKVCGIECPWKFWDTRDTRTIYSLTNVDLRNISIDGYKSHNAIGDCLKQIEGIKQSYSIINSVKNDKKKRKF